MFVGVLGGSAGRVSFVRPHDDQFPLDVCAPGPAGQRSSIGLVQPAASLSWNGCEDAAKVIRLAKNTRRGVGQERAASDGEKDEDSIVFGRVLIFIRP